MNTEFADMSHGWTCRGDLSDEKIAAGVKLAMESMSNFFNERL